MWTIFHPTVPIERHVTKEMNRTHQWISWFPGKLLPQELNDRLEAIRCSNFIEVLFHNWSVANCFESYYDYILHINAGSDEDESLYAPLEGSFFLYVSSAVRASVMFSPLSEVPAPSADRAWARMSGLPVVNAMREDFTATWILSSTYLIRLAIEEAEFTILEVLCLPCPSFTTPAPIRSTWGITCSLLTSRPLQSTTITVCLPVAHWLTDGWIVLASGSIWN